MKRKYINATVIITILYVIIFFAFASGMINAVMEGQDYNQPIVLPTRSIQNNYETVIGVSILIFGFVGAVLAYKALYVNKLNEKYTLLGSGFIIIILSMFFMYRIMDLKV